MNIGFLLFLLLTKLGNSSVIGYSIILNGNYVMVRGFHLWKEGLGTQEMFKDVPRPCRKKTREAKAQLELEEIQSLQSTFPSQNAILCWSINGTGMLSAELLKPKDTYPNARDGLLGLNHSKAPIPP